VNGSTKVHRRAFAPGRLTCHPGWISVHDNPVGLAAGVEKLQAGERNATLLAETVHADIVLLDEKLPPNVACV
jgi:predicted nucleic acid-binding protein